MLVERLCNVLNDRNNISLIILIPTFTLIELILLSELVRSIQPSKPGRKNLATRGLKETETTGSIIAKTLKDTEKWVSIRKKINLGEESNAISIQMHASTMDTDR